MEIVSDPKNNNSIQWTPDGKAFIITDRKKFEKDILDRHFYGVKYTSFTRRLSRWGFVCHSKCAEQCVYLHHSFCRDQPEDCLYISPSNTSTDGKQNRAKHRTVLKTDKLNARNNQKNSRMNEVNHERSVIRTGVDQNQSVLQRLALIREINRIHVNDIVRRASIRNEIDIVRGMIQRITMVRSLSEINRQRYIDRVVLQCAMDRVRRARETLLINQALSNRILHKTL